MRYVYHVTFLGRLRLVAKHGLLPNENLRSSMGQGGYAGHSRGKLFLTSAEGVPYWYHKAEAAANDLSDDPLREGYTPVVLRVPMHRDMQADTVGSRDAMAPAWFLRAGIYPRSIRFWNGKAWLPVHDWHIIDAKQAYEYDSFGEYWSFRYQYANPLAIIKV